MVKNQFEDKRFYTVGSVLDEIMDFTKKWSFHDSAGCPWYRGQDSESPPIPSLFRDHFDEFQLNTTFRNRALALKQSPETERIDKWLFLMQHYGAPTRLLDWTESPILALFFAFDSFNEKCNCEKEKNNPTIWALHPYKLNEFSKISCFPNTWSSHDVKDDSDKVINTNPGLEHFRLGFHPKSEWNKRINLEIVKYPIAIHSNYFDLRILSQRSCFTIHGTIEKDLVSIFENTPLIKDNFLLKFIIPREYVSQFLSELNSMGISKSTVYPDIEHLALDLKERFRVAKNQDDSNSSSTKAVNGSGYAST